MRNHWKRNWSFHQCYQTRRRYFSKVYQIEDQQLIKKTKTVDVLHRGIRCEKGAYFKHKGFENVYQLKWHHEYTKGKEEVWNKFIGKKFCVWSPLGELLTISFQMPSMRPCDVHKLYEWRLSFAFIQCEEMCTVNGRLLFRTCINVIHLPEEDKNDSQRYKNGNMIFKKENQMYWLSKTIKKFTEHCWLRVPKQSLKKWQKQYVGKGTHFPKTKYWSILGEDNELTLETYVLVKGDYRWAKITIKKC
jgi:hypothetical protein